MKNARISELRWPLRVSRAGPQGRDDHRLWPGHTDRQDRADYPRGERARVAPECVSPRDRDSPANPRRSQDNAAALQAKETRTPAGGAARGTADRTV